MKTIILCLGFFIFSCIPIISQQYYVEASRTAIIRENPDKNSDALLTLEKGNQLNTVSEEQTNNFYHVFLPNGETGWVSRYVVRLYSGNAPEVPTIAVMPNVGAGLTTAEREYASFHLAIGKPKGYKELIRKGFVIGYDPTRKIPLWIQYRLTKERSERDAYARPNEFDEDFEIHTTGRSTLEDYSSGSPNYVRGHLAPADDMRWDERAVKESMLLTNISPQVGDGFNNSIWKTLENRVRAWAIDREDIIVICGPVFEVHPSVFSLSRQYPTANQMIYNVIGKNNVAVATKFFKIIVDMRNPESPDVLAFLMPNISTNAGEERNIENYLTNVDNIEALTGLDFLTNLSEQVQEEIESRIAQHIW
jgi:endonuclease G